MHESVYKILQTLPCSHIPTFISTFSLPSHGSSLHEVLKLFQQSFKTQNSFHSFQSKQAYEYFIVTWVFNQVPNVRPRDYYEYSLIFVVLLPFCHALLLVNALPEFIFFVICRNRI